MHSNLQFCLIIHCYQQLVAVSLFVSIQICECCRNLKINESISILCHKVFGGQLFDVDAPYRTVFTLPT